MLESYAAQRGFTNISHYTDDGWSGANFERPSWKQLVADIEAGKIGCVIAKDMSRVGRDYLQTGFYTEVLFQQHGVRFIAISNGVDSADQSTGEFAPFINIMSEWYVRDCSRKQKAQYQVRCKSGKPVTNNIPFGFKKDRSEKHHWLVDEERRELQTLVSDISHQVKTPVANLKMVTDTLLAKPVTEQERRDFLQGIRSQTDKLEFLVQSMGKASRLETGAVTLEKKDVPLLDTLAQAMSGIVYGAEQKGISVEVQCPDDLRVSHDSKWTAEALFNLLDNAVKYTPAGGKISVSVEQWEMYVKLDVSDTGKGIPESRQAAIFRRFYREEEVHDQPGVGIGLYLAREIVTRQGGYIKVTSEVGRGSTFSVFLPRR